MFTCNFLMAYDVKHLFICLFMFCISSLVKFLFKSFVYFLSELLIVLLLSFKSYLHILANSLTSIGYSESFCSQEAVILENCFTLQLGGTDWTYDLNSLLDIRRIVGFQFVQLFFSCFEDESDDFQGFYMPDLNQEVWYFF